MNFNDILGPIVEFFSHGIGAFFADLAKMLYYFTFPSNAEAATPIEIPR